MTIEEAQAIIDKTNSPYLKRDMEKFIKRQRRKEGVYGKAEKGSSSRIYAACNARLRKSAAGSV